MEVITRRKPTLEKLAEITENTIDILSGGTEGVFEALGVYATMPIGLLPTSSELDEKRRELETTTKMFRIGYNIGYYGTIAAAPFVVGGVVLYSIFN